MQVLKRASVQCGLRAVAAGMLLLLTACGWQLQGTRHVSESLTPMYMELSDAHSDFSNALQQRLRLAGVRFTDDSASPHTTLHVSKDEFGRRVISVSTSNTPLEYEVFYNVELEVRSPSGEVLLQQPLSTSRSYTYNEAAALAKQREERVITETLASELADQVMRQIRTL